MKPGFVVDIVAATSRIDASLAARAVDEVLAWPQTYKPDDVLVPAALALVKLEESKTWPAAERLRMASLDHLRGRIALPLEASRDWIRSNPLKCNCSDCHELGVFLLAPDQKQWRLKAVQTRRSHVEQEVRHAVCDLDLATERRGSPHTLVATKNQAPRGSGECGGANRMIAAQRTRSADVSEERMSEKRKCPPHDLIGTAAKALSDQRLRRRH